jgi:hypothetical protein
MAALKDVSHKPLADVRRFSLNLDALQHSVMVDFPGSQAAARRP